MHIQRLLVRNYRSIKELDVAFSSGKNVIIGRNNAGKSNLVKALDVVLGEYSPTYAKGDVITEQDFYCEHNADGTPEHAIEMYIWCELARDNDERLDFEELYDVYSFYVYNELLSREILPDQLDVIFGVQDDSSTARRYINTRNRASGVLEKEFDNKFNFAYAFYARRNVSGEIIREMRFLYRQHAASDWVLAFRPILRSTLLQTAVIPSFRDPNSQLRLNKWSWYGKMLSALCDQGQRSPELLKAFEQVQAVGDSVFRDVREKLTQSSLSVAFPGTDIIFQFNMDTGPDLYRNCTIYIDDGYKSPLTEKGSGLQSATIIGLFTYYTQQVNATKSALLCVEEPEVYLHPHARRVVSDQLDEFLSGPKHQVILTTHSAEFIRSHRRDLSVALVRKDATGTHAKVVKLEEYRGLLVDANQQEMFFADKVILCEGLDSYVVRAIADEVRPRWLDQHNISVVSVGGKDSLCRLAKLVVKLGIDCFVLADFDFLLRDKHEARQQYGADAHDNVLGLSEAFFQQTCVFDRGARKAISYIERLRNELKAENEQAFYTAKTADCFVHAKLQKALSVMRQHGLYVLDGEIEHLSRDPRFLAPGTNKLSIKKVYELNARLSSGGSVRDLFDIEPIEDLLNIVENS